MLLLCSSANALDQERLWLPVKYHKYYLDLVEAAEAAERLDNCTEVLQGQMDFDQSQPDHPIFRILCRRHDGLSYNEMVDGLSKATLTTVIPTPRVLTPEEIEQQRLLEQKKLEEERQQRKAAFWARCEQEFKSQTEYMAQMVLLGEMPPEPTTFENSNAKFKFNFDAKDISGTPLKYRVSCSVNEDSVEVKIKPRR